MFPSMLSILVPNDSTGCSFLYRSIFPWVIGCFRTRKAVFLGLWLSKARICCILIIASISFGWTFLLMPHFLNRSLYCLGLCQVSSEIEERSGRALRSIKPITFPHGLNDIVQGAVLVQPCDLWPVDIPVFCRIFLQFFLLVRWRKCCLPLWLLSKVRLLGIQVCRKRLQRNECVPLALDWWWVHDFVK